MTEFKDLMGELRNYPQQIHEAEQKAEELRESWSIARTQRDYSFAASFLRSKAKGYPESQSKQVAIQEVYEADQKLVAMESQYRKAMSDHVFLENQFKAASKIANMQEAALMKLGAFE